MPSIHRVLRLDIHSYWHPGTGRGDGASADAVVNEDALGLPTLPGRTLKGLLRAAFSNWVHLGAPGARSESENELFGSVLNAPPTSDNRVSSLEAAKFSRVSSLEAARFRTEAGALRVDSATLGETAEQRRAWEDFASSGSAEARAQLALLKRSFASTRLDENGVAQDSTLRSVELFVPMSLFARIQLQHAEAPRLMAELSEAAHLFLRGLGSYRNRGLGRCTATLIEVPRA
jgi:hypothetical protein